MEHFWGEANIGPKKVPVWRVLCIVWLDIFSPADSLLASSITFSYREIGCFLLIVSRQSCSFLGKAHRSSSVNGYFVSAKICVIFQMLAWQSVVAKRAGWLDADTCKRHALVTETLTIAICTCSCVLVFLDKDIVWYICGMVLFSWHLGGSRLCRI